LKWSLSSLGFDAYERRARLYPSLIAAFPAVVVPMVLLPHVMFEHYSRSLFALFAYVGLFYLLANLARSEGKRIEPRLLEMWDGWPTTVMLRHRDHAIDPHTKKRYHEALAKIARDVTLPSSAKERQNPIRADEAYRSATKKLLESRRGEKYRLVHSENAEYGFRRNMLGLKPWAIGLLVAVGFSLILVWWLRYRLAPISANLVLNDLQQRWRVYLLFAGDLTGLLFWIAYVRPNWVHGAAVDYAHALFRTLESASSKSL
jgi:hypothetical protein